MKCICIGGPKHGESVELPEQTSWKFPLTAPDAQPGEEVYYLLSAVLWGCKTPCLVHRSCIQDSRSYFETFTPDEGAPV